MKAYPYASLVGTLMYAQICTRPDIAYVVGVLGRFQSDPGLDHWRTAKKVLRYLQGTQDYMLTYNKSDLLEIVGYTNSNFLDVQIVESQHQVISFYLLVVRFLGEV
jgi:hypothetical protein